MSGPKGESGIKGNKNEKRGKPLAFIRDLIDRYYAHDVARDGAALTYYLLFAIFPLLVFVSTLVGLMDLDIEETLTAMSRILPEQVLGIVGSYLEYVSTSPSRQLLVFSLIFSVWFPLRATSCLMHSVRKAYGVPQPPSMIGGTLRNLIFTLWLIVTIAASIVLTTVGRRALQFVSGLIHIPDQFINVWETLRFAVLGVIMLLVLVPLTVLVFSRFDRKYYLAGLAIIVLTTAAFFLHFESRRPQARELVILAVLCALAVASRAAFAAVPHFKPMLAIVMLTGIAFGPEAGFLCGAISGFASNFIFGQGPWTPWQMFAYGIGGLLAGLFAMWGILKKAPKGWKDVIILAVFGFFGILLVVGPLLDTSTFFTVATSYDAASVLAVYLAGVPVNCVHGAAVALTMLLFGKPLLERLQRIQIKYGMMEP